MDDNSQDAAAQSGGGSNKQGSMSSTAPLYDCIFNRPTGLDVDTRNGFVYIADNGNNAIRQVSINDPAHPVVTIAEDPLLNNPFGVVIDVTNQMLYVTSFNGHAVFQIILDGYYPTPITTNNIFVGSDTGS